MVSQYYGGTMDPGQLNSCLTNNGGYASGCLIIWANSCLPNGVSYQGMTGDIDTELSAGRPVIAHVSNPSISMHFVVIVGNENGQRQILDPYWPAYQTIADGNYTIESIRLYDGNVAQACGVVVTSAAETVIDDLDPCFFRHGTYWWDSATGYDGHHYFTYAVDDPNPDCWAEWRFDVQDSGDYEVSVFIPPQDADSVSARYTVDHGGGQDDVVVDQAASSEWTSLGTFTFQAGAGRSIALFDNTGEPLSANVPIGFDAVRLVPAGSSQTDAGIPGPDATTGDAGTDDGSLHDAAASGDASPGPANPGAGGGCSCRSAGSTDFGFAVPLLIWLLLAGRRGRRGRS
jgi:hypothetical protein